MNVFQPAYQTKRTVPALFMVARTGARVERARVASELNAIWPVMPITASWSRHTPAAAGQGFVACSQCHRVLYKATARSVDRVLAAMEAS